MVDLEELNILAQLVDNVERSISRLELAYSENNNAEFNEAKRNILDFQEKISAIIK